MIFLRQSTASQEVPLGYFVDSTDGNTEETALTIANTDIKLWKTGATTLANKNSGGATHISNGIYYAVLDATDTDTIGPMVIFVHVSGALTVRLECCVLDEAVYDVQFGTTAPATATNITAGTITTATNVTTVNGLAAGVITAASIAADAITAAKIADGAIDAATFAAGAINAAAIAADAIGASELAADAATEIATAVTTALGTGTGLTAIPWNASWDAEVQSEVQDAIEANHLDHFIAVADPGGVVANSSFLAKLCSKSATPAFSSYDNTTDSLEANRDNIGTAGAGLTSADDAVIAAIAGVQADTDDIQTRLPAALTADGNMKSDALRFGGTLYATALAAEVDAVWDEDATGHQTQGTFGQAIGDPAADTDTLFSMLSFMYDSGVTVSGIQPNVISAGVIAANAIGASELAADAVTEIAAGVLTTALTESYNADGAAPTLTQAVMVIMQMLTEMSISGTTMTVKRLDGSTTALTLTLNSATTPTSVTRAT